jgi:hypothetical protein
VPVYHLPAIGCGRFVAEPGFDLFLVADQETLVLLKRFSHNPEVEKASVEFERAQKSEQRFHRDFDGLGLH